MTTMSANTSACPTCSAYTVAMPKGQGDYCPTCLTVVKRFRNVRLVQPNGFRPEGVLF